MTEKIIDKENLSNSLINLTMESWRFSKLFERILTKIDAGERSRYESQHQWYLKKLQETLDDAGMKLVNIEGHKYEAGVAATALNIDEFAQNDSLVIKQMLEPIIMGSEGVLRQGTVILGKL